MLHPVVHKPRKTVSRLPRNLNQWVVGMVNHSSVKATGKDTPALGFGKDRDLIHHHAVFERMPAWRKLAIKSNSQRVVSVDWNPHVPSKNVAVVRDGVKGRLLSVHVQECSPCDGLPLCRNEVLPDGNGLISCDPICPEIGVDAEPQPEIRAKLKTERPRSRPGSVGHKGRPQRGRGGGIPVGWASDTHPKLNRKTKCIRDLARWHAGALHILRCNVAFPGAVSVVRLVRCERGRGAADGHAVNTRRLLSHKPRPEAHVRVGHIGQHVHGVAGAAHRHHCRLGARRERVNGEEVHLIHEGLCGIVAGHGRGHEPHTRSRVERLSTWPCSIEILAILARELGPNVQHHSFPRRLGHIPGLVTVHGFCGARAETDGEEAPGVTQRPASAVPWLGCWASQVLEHSHPQRHSPASWHSRRLSGKSKVCRRSDWPRQYRRSE